jgi:hypothetical protein
MPETVDPLVALRDVGVTPPMAGDSGDAQIRIALQREIVGRPPAWPTRRPTARFSLLAVTALLAAGVAVAVALTVGGRSPRAVPSTGGPPPAARETAYIVRRVRARLAQLATAGQGLVLERTGTIGNGTPGDPIVHNSDWAYVDPRSGIAYQRSVDRAAGGAVLSINTLVTTPVNGVLHTKVRFLDPSSGTYFVTGHAPPGGTIAEARAAGTQLGIRSTARQIEQALKSGAVTQRGTATVDGKPTIKLLVPPSPALVSVGLPRDTTITLYVDEKTYLPVEQVDDVPVGHDGSAGHNTSVSRWLPATPLNIALTRSRVPTGYRQVSGPITHFWTDSKPLFFIGY